MVGHIFTDPRRKGEEADVYDIFHEKMKQLGYKEVEGGYDVPELGIIKLDEHGYYEVV